MRVLGVDPGLTRCGVGVVEGQPGRPCRLVGYEVVRSDPGAGLPERLLNLEGALTRLLRLETAPRPADAADALALAICHVWRGGARSKLAEAAALAKAAPRGATPAAAPRGATPDAGPRGATAAARGRSRSLP